MRRVTGNQADNAQTVVLTCPALKKYEVLEVMWFTSGAAAVATNLLVNLGGGGVMVAGQPAPTALGQAVVRLTYNALAILAGDQLDLGLYGNGGVARYYVVYMDVDVPA
jgi:hypothetical protein